MGWKFEKIKIKVGDPVKVKQEVIDDLLTRLKRLKEDAVVKPIQIVYGDMHDNTEVNLKNMDGRIYARLSLKIKPTYLYPDGWYTFAAYFEEDEL